MNVNDIIAAVPGLSPSDRNKVRGALGVYASADSETPGSGENDRVWEAVIHQGSIHSLNIPPYRAMMQTKYAAKLKSGSEQVLAYVDKYLKGLTVTEEISSLRMLVETLFIWMEKSKIPRTPRAIIYNLINVPEAVDDQFPGYAESGHLSWALKGE